MRLKIAMVGQAPGNGKDPGKPLTGRVGRRLAELMGVSMRTYLLRTVRSNLLKEFPGKNGKGDAFPVEEARNAASAWGVPGDAVCVVLVGLNVARAFGHGNAPTCSAFLAEFRCERPRHQFRVTPCFVIPHPSGINTWYNNPRNAAKARHALEGANALLRSTGAGRAVWQAGHSVGKTQLTQNFLKASGLIPRDR